MVVADDRLLGEVDEGFGLFVRLDVLVQPFY